MHRNKSGFSSEYNKAHFIYSVFIYSASLSKRNSLKNDVDSDVFVKLDIFCCAKVEAEVLMYVCPSICVCAS